MSFRRMITGVALAGAALAATAPSTFADAPSTPGGTNFGQGQVRTCTTDYQPGVQGQYGAWGAFVDGCTVKVRCSFKEGCTVGGRGMIQDEQLGGHRVTLNSRLRLLDVRGRRTMKRFDNSCDAAGTCTAGQIDRFLPYRNVASVQCNGVHEAAAGSASVTCTVQALRGYEFVGLRGADNVQTCPGADTPVDQLSDQEAEASVMCLTSHERVVAGLPGLTYDASLAGAAGDEAADAVSSPWWADGADWHFNPHSQTTPAQRITAAGYCADAKAVNLDRPENVYTAYSMGTGAAAPTPREAVRWWMTHAPPDENGHRMAILNPEATEIGAGVVPATAIPGVSPDKGGTFVQTFGSCVR